MLQLRSLLVLLAVQVVRELVVPNPVPGIWNHLCLFQCHCFWVVCELIVSNPVPGI